MIEREIREIKRRFRPERSNISRIVGCFVNGGGSIVSRISQSLGLCDETVSEKLLAIMKKSLSGSLGTSLTEVRFSTKEVLEGEKHKLLMRLRDSDLSDSDALEAFYASVIERVKFDGNYVILLARDVYDVPAYRSDGEGGESDTQFTYLLCSVCPLKDSADVLSFRESDSLFHNSLATAYLTSPEYGFMFPAFDDRAANIYGALLYTKNLGVSAECFTESVFGKEAPMPPKAQKEAFDGIMGAALSDACSLDVVRSVNAQVAEMIEAHKESREPEPLLITKNTLSELLCGAGVENEAVERACEAFDESFGKGAAVAPKNIVTPGKFDVKMPEVSIKVSPEYRDVVSTRVIDGEKYLMIRVTGGVSVNGIDVTFDGGK